MVTEVTGTPPKIVERAFTIPVVSDVCTGIASVPLVRPCVKLTVNTGSYMAGGVNMVTSRIPSLPGSTVIEKVGDVASNAIGRLDTMACSGLDQLVTRVPVLKEPTPVLVRTTKDSAAGVVTSYLGNMFGRSKPGLEVEVEREDDLLLDTEEVTTQGEDPPQEERSEPAAGTEQLKSWNQEDKRRAIDLHHRLSPVFDLHQISHRAAADIIAIVTESDK